MPDFTNLDPGLIASFWIYFLASFIIGGVVGILGSKLFFHREKNYIEQQKRNCEKILEENEHIKKELNNKTSELEQLKSLISTNELYWNTVKNRKNKAPGDEALYKLIHKADDKTIFR